MADNVASQILDQLRASLSGVRYSASAVLAGIAVSFGGSLIILVLFLTFWSSFKGVWCRKKLTSTESNSDDTVKVKLSSCINDMWKLSEPEIQQKLGLDATVFLRVIRMQRNVFIILTVLLCGVCIPINVVYNMKSPFLANLTKSDALLLMTPTLLSGVQMIPHVILAWVTNIVIYVYIWYIYRFNLVSRRQVLCSPEFASKLINRSVLIQDIPNGRHTISYLASLVKETFPDVNPTGIAIGHSVKDLDKLLQQYKHCLRKYEKMSCRKDVNIPELNSCGRRLELLANEIYRERQECQASPDPRSYGFVSFSQIIESHRVAHKAFHKSMHGTKMSLAPSPQDILWSNLGLSWTERTHKQIWINVIYIFLVLMWIVPNAFIGCFLANLSRLATVWPKFGIAMAEHKVLFAVLQGFLAPMVSEIVFSSLPMLFRLFSRWQGKVTRNEREQEVLRKLNFFYFFDNLLVFSLIGAIWDIVAQVIQAVNNSSGAKPTFSEVFTSLRVPQRIATAIVNMSSFWVMYLAKAVLGSTFNLVEVWSLILKTLQATRVIRATTPREKLEQSQPQQFFYAAEYKSIIFYSTVALAFTTIQPLILPFTALYFAVSLPMKKYTLMFNRVTKYESVGMYWPIVNNMLLFAVGFGNLMVFCVIAVQGGWKIAMGTAPLPFTVVIFKIYIYYKYDRKYTFIDSYLQSNGSGPSAFDDTNIIPDPNIVTFGRHQRYNVGEAYENPSMTSPLDEPMLDDGTSQLDCQSRDSGVGSHSSQYTFEEKMHEKIIYYHGTEKLL